MRLFVSKCVVMICFFEIMEDVHCVKEKMAKSRRRRYISFPEGSTFIATLCDTVATTTEFGIYFQGINWGTGWLLPNRSSVLGYVTEHKHKRKRKERREIYSKVEDILKAIGHDGSSCISRALCEAPRRFKTKSTKLSQELLRIFFKFPLQSLSDEEPVDHHLYHKAHRIGKEEQQNCAELYPACPISLIDLALGYYNYDPFNDNT